MSGGSAEVTVSEFGAGPRGTKGLAAEAALNWIESACGGNQKVASLNLSGSSFPLCILSDLPDSIQGVFGLGKAIFNRPSVRFLRSPHGSNSFSGQRKSFQPKGPSRTCFQWFMSGTGVAIAKSRRSGAQRGALENKLRPEVFLSAPLLFPEIPARSAFQTRS